MTEPTSAAPGSTAGLFDRARSGDQAAWRELFDACYPKVLRVIRRKLTSPAMRSLYDSTDFVGDVWKSLAEKPERFDFPTVEALLAFLALAAERKVIDKHRQLHAQRNDIGRQRPMGAWPGAGAGPRELPSGDPTPSQVAQEGEARDRLLSGRTDEDRRVIELKSQGYTHEEIAGASGWHLRKVQRFFKDLGDSWTAGSRGARP